MKSFDYSVTRNRKVYKVLMPLARIVAHITHPKINYIGIENVPKEGGFIVASNHITALDPLYIGCRFPRNIHFMGKEELFKKSFIGCFLTHMNCFPISRGAANKVSIDYAIKVIKEGNVLGIFPEGTRSKDYTPGAPKAGVALISVATGADILPVSIYTSKKAKLGTELTIRFGEIIPFTRLGISSTEQHTARELKDASKIIMERITDIWKLEHKK